jgi:hypothetical protein
MQVQIAFWDLVLLLLGFFAACAGAGKLLLSMHQRHLDDRLQTLEEARKESHNQLGARLGGIEAANREEASQWQRVERELMALKAELPLHYVRREDYVQAVATIMTKLDAMALRFENILLRGENRERK